ncbi:alpha/beta fold hydrolase [Microlunatus speluncae]|uniref:alpha/beta fold hydrolase n=1 Tax=Microlunatus speluncae TaxID=2594267 RepID=UPI0012662CCD|nr:alpha/beta hydrolase [Microlunatus speluncae]
MDIILIPGMWLTGAVWRETADELVRFGHRPVALTLPGQGDGASTATLDDQLAAVLAAVDAADRPLVVGHSAASALAWLVADRRPDGVARVALVGGFPTADGDPYFSAFPIVDGVMAFPGWEPFAGPDIADLDEPLRRELAAGAVAVPEGVTGGIVRLTDERRFDVPVTLVCPEFSAADAKEWVDGGDLPELARAGDVSYADIDSGHWPMTSRPAELARVLDGVARGVS